jgi:predicted phosphodiesterase
VRIGWLSDIHLNFLEDIEVSAFVSELTSVDVDAWVVSGDIGESHSFKDYLCRLVKGLKRPMYVVLGNHDYYHSSIAEVTAQFKDTSSNVSLAWLSSSDPLFLDGHLAVVGDDGWGDARFGDPTGSQVELNDFYYISELTGLTRLELIQSANALGDACAARLAPKLEEAASQCRNVCVVTHVPPFEGAAWHHGRISDPDWLPWFSCASIGRVAMECAGRHPKVRFTVLCGHTHSRGYFEASQNVVVHTAGAKYGEPELQGVLKVDGDRFHMCSN